MSLEGPVLRLFEVQAKPNCTDTLLQQFSTISAQVVKGHPGNHGYFFGRCLEGPGDRLMFVSLWKDLAAIQARFGADWQASYLPEGYEDLIESCSLRHVDLKDGWQVEDLSAPQ